MTNEEKIKILEYKYQKLSEDFDILTNSIHRLPAIVLICFLSGLIIGFLL